MKPRRGVLNFFYFGGREKINVLSVVGSFCSHVKHGEEEQFFVF